MCHIEVRRALVQHVKREWHKYRMFLTDEDRDGYIPSMHRPGTWGDEIMLAAFATRYRRRVRVRHGDRTHDYGRASDPCREVLFSGNHYDAVYSTASSWGRPRLAKNVVESAEAVLSPKSLHTS